MAAAARTWWPENGWLTIMVHNYGGARSRVKNVTHNRELNGIIREMLMEYPAQLLFLQEHDLSILTDDDKYEFHSIVDMKDEKDAPPNWMDIQ